MHTKCTGGKLELVEAAHYILSCIIYLTLYFWQQKIRNTVVCRMITGEEKVLGSNYRFSFCVSIDFLQK